MNTKGRRADVPATGAYGRAPATGRLATVVLALAAALLLPAAASAAVNVGSSFPAAGGAAACTGNDASIDADDFPCVLIQDTIGGQPVQGPPGGGVITKWRVSGAAGTIALRVMRPNGQPSGQVSALTINESPDEEASGGVEEFVTRQSIAAGDYIGAVLQNPGSRIGGRNAAPGEGTKLFEGPGELNFDDPFTTGNVADAEILLRATVEPDADDDGYGDETQDDDGGNTGGDDGGGGGDFGGDDGGDEPPPADPLAALRAGKAPVASLRGKVVKASRKGVIRVKIANPNGYRIKGTLVVKAKRRKIGSAAFSVAAESSRSVSVKLSRKGRRALAKRRRLGVVVTAKFKGPIGKAGTAKKKLTIKAAPKPKPKPRPRRPGGGGGGGGGGLSPSPGCRMEYVSGGMEYDTLAGTYVFVPGGWKMRCGY